MSILNNYKSHKGRGAGGEGENYSSQRGLGLSRYRNKIDINVAMLWRSGIFNAEKILVLILFEQFLTEYVYIGCL